jgi:hypothetical protein
VNAPCCGQTAEEIEKWLRENVALGAEVAVRATYGGSAYYGIAKVVRLGKVFELDESRRANSDPSSATLFVSDYTPNPTPP